MIRLKTEYQTKTLYRLLKKIAQRYNNKGKCLERNAELLNEIGCVLTKGEWLISGKEELVQTIRRRLEEFHPYLKNPNYVASKIAVSIIGQMQNNSTCHKRVFTDIKDYL